MASHIKVHELELSRPLKDLSGLDEYTELYILLRWHDVPLGCLHLPIQNDQCSASTLHAAINQTHKNKIADARLRRHLDKPIGLNPSMGMPSFEPDPYTDDRLDKPLVTVAVCSRDRTQQLESCLSSLSKLAYSNIEFLVVDNAPTTDETKQLVQTSFPDFHYLVEPRPGLDWARNCAIEHARGQIIAFTDDDVVVDPLWIKALVNVFQYDSAIMAVTGLVLPYELETPAQNYFENNGGFGRGYKRQWFTPSSGQTFHIGAGRFGTGANMAFRRRVFQQIGGFDPALDVGTVTNGGGDLEMFFRILEQGHTLVYEPAALVWHKHRKTIEDLRIQLTNNGVGLYSYFVRSAMAYPHRRKSFFRFGLWWFWKWNVRRLLKSFVVKPPIPRTLILAELLGSVSGLGRYSKAKRRAEEIQAVYADDYPDSLHRNL